jgi:hypothetical protein
MPIHLSYFAKLALTLSYLILLLFFYIVDTKSLYSRLKKIKINNQEVAQYLQNNAEAYKKIMAKRSLNIPKAFQDTTLKHIRAIAKKNNVRLNKIIHTPKSISNQLELTMAGDFYALLNCLKQINDAGINLKILQGKFEVSHTKHQYLNALNLNLILIWHTGIL